MTDIVTLEKIVGTLGVLSNTVGNLVNSVNILKDQVKEIQDERLIRRVYDIESDLREIRRSVDRFDIR